MHPKKVSYKNDILWIIDVFAPVPMLLLVGLVGLAMIAMFTAMLFSTLSWSLMALSDFATSLAKCLKVDDLQNSHALLFYITGKVNENSDTCGETWQEQAGLPCSSVAFLCVRILDICVCVDVNPHVYVKAYVTVNVSTCICTQNIS